jgi:CRISPR-associated protein Cmr2
MMMADHGAQEIAFAQMLIEELEQIEAKAGAARAASERREAERRARDVRLKLLKKHDPSTLFLYLAATRAASHESFRSTWQEKAISVDETVRLRDSGIWDFYQTYWACPEPDLTILPRCSFSLRFTFTLAQPYLSKDDNAFYIIDNPIVRDKVFRLPLVRPSSWKGNLRSALRQLGHADGAPAIRRLFGEASDAVGEERSRAGRLVFFPTFFTQTSLEIINPHDREKKVGRNPILFESVPPRATGSFTLLYVPFDLVGEEAEETARQLAEDLPLLA